MKYGWATSKRARLNRGRRFTDEERVRIGRVVSDFRPLVVRELRRLPAWIRKRHWEEAEEMLMVEVMWGAVEFDAAKCGEGGTLAGYLAYRVSWKRKSLVSRFAGMAPEGETSLEDAPVPVARGNAVKASEDREEVERVLTREAAACERRGWAGRWKRVGEIGPVLEERYLMGLTLEEIARRRGVSRETVSQAVERAVEAVRGGG
jgi:hypothetical protein